MTEHIIDGERSKAFANLLPVPVPGTLVPCAIISKNDEGSDVHSETVSNLLFDADTGTGQGQEQGELHGQLTCPPTDSQQQQNLLSNPKVRSMTWEEAVVLPILPVRCNGTNADLYKEKFGSGNKGKCIKFDNNWYTPTEFETVSGRANCKDWKRSIRFGGRILNQLIQRGHLTLHACCCTCAICTDDFGAAGPIRHFVPYRRKRKGEIVTDGVNGKRRRRSTYKDSPNDESSDISLNVVPNSAQTFMQMENFCLPSCPQEAWKVVEDAVDNLSTAAASLKTIVQEMKNRTNKEVDDLKSQLQNSIQTAQTHVENPASAIGPPQIIRVFDSNQIQNCFIQVLDPQTLQSNSSAVLPKCVNCGRDGILKCTGCHIVHYCSAFCQARDWPLHYEACPTVESKEELVL